MMYEKAFKQLLVHHNIPQDDNPVNRLVSEYAKIFFEAGVKAAFNESAQTPVLFKEKTHGN